jgi:hypothetical protein
VPLEVLTGRWAFNTEGTGLPFDQRGHGTGHARRLADSSADEPLGSGLKRGLGRPVASAGSFEASVDPKAGGVLTITVTTSRNGQIVQLETGDGSYDLFPDCSGGTLSFNLESGPVAYDFFFVPSTIYSSSVEILERRSGVWGRRDWDCQCRLLPALPWLGFARFRERVLALIMVNFRLARVMTFVASDHPPPPFVPS